MDNASRFYAVRAGRETGIFTTWQECKAQIDGYSGAVFKSFSTQAEAENFINTSDTKPPIKDNLPYAYIDGTYSKKNNCYGWGGFLVNAGSCHIIQGTGNNPAYISERNVAGEVIGALQVFFKAQRLGIKELNLFYDYSGIENWTDGSWKASKPLARYYTQTNELLEDDVKVNFIKVAGHTGIKGNELADLLAKEIAGVKLRKKDIIALENFRQAAKEGGETWK